MNLHCDFFYYATCAVDPLKLGRIRAVREKVTMQLSAN